MIALDRFTGTMLVALELAIDAKVIRDAHIRPE